MEVQGHSGRPSAVAAAGEVAAAGATAAKDQHEGCTQDSAGMVSQPRPMGASCWGGSMLKRLQRRASSASLGATQTLPV